MVDAEHHAPSRRLVPFGLSGLAVAALGLVAQWVAMPSLFAPAPFPFGLVFLAVAAAAVGLDRRTPGSVAAAGLIGVWILVGGLWEGELSRNLTSGDPGVVIGTVVLVAGLLLAVAAAVAGACTRTAAPRPSGVGLPRRVPRWVAAAGMLADAVGDALPEGLHPDGPGPLLFVILAVVVAAVPSRAVVAVAATLTLFLLVGGLTSAELPVRLADPSDVLTFTGALLQLVGLALAVLASLVALLPVPRAASAGPRDRRTADVRGPA